MSAYHSLLILLAIVDLIVCIASAFRSSTDVLNKRLTSFKIIFNFFQKSLTATSVYILVIISFLRYKAIASPLKRQWSKKCYFLICFFCFCCCSSFWQFKVLKIELPIIYIDTALIGIVPLVILCFFVYKISRSLNSNTLDKYKHSENNNNNNTIANDQIRKRNIIALNTVKCLTLIYFVTTVLARIGTTTIRKRNDEKNVYNFKIYHSITDLVYLSNNVANLFVYAKFIKDFRRFLWNIIACRCMKQTLTIWFT